MLPAGVIRVSLLGRDAGDAGDEEEEKKKFSHR
jgi:hypothetical protein